MVKLKAMENNLEVAIEPITEMEVNGSNYLIYTKNEEVNNGVKIYASKIVEEDGLIRLTGVDEGTWNILKSKIANVVRGND